MIRIELTDEEGGALQELLEYALSELRMEIADTDRKDFREKLKARKQLLMAVQKKLLSEGPA